MHVTRTPALGRRFLVKSQMPNMPWALEFFFSAVILVITVLGGKEEVCCAYDGQTSPSLAREPGFIQHLKGEREKGWSQRV
jgi:hypothetical protein